MQGVFTFDFELRGGRKIKINRTKRLVDLGPQRTQARHVDYLQ